MSGDSEVGCGKFQMTGGTLTSTNGGLFYTTNTESEILLQNVAITAAEDSEFFLLPGRAALGLDAETGRVEELEGGDSLAVAVFASPAHTLSATAAYRTRPGAPVLPLFAYGALGFYEGRFYVCARRVDQEDRPRRNGSAMA